MKKLLKIFPILMMIMLLASGCGNGTTQATSDGNLILNSGFENSTGASVSEWILDRYDTSVSIGESGATETVSAPDGSNVLVLESTDFNDARYMQTVSVEKNSYYKLSALVKTGTLENRNNDSGVTIGFWNTNCCSNYITSDTDWTEVTVYGKTDKKTDEITVALRLGFFCADCKGTAYFDNVVLEKVNEVPSDANVGSLSTAATTVNESDNSTNSTDEKTVGSIELATILRGTLYFAIIILFLIFAFKNQDKFNINIAYVIVGISFILRIIASFSYKGFSVDIGCFSAWATKMSSDGITKFYSEGMFCDYPPLYMIVLGFISLITPSISLTEGFGLVMLKMPAMLADILSALMIIKIAKKHLGNNIAAILGIIYAMLPTAIVNSAVWGQVDSILVLFMLITFYLVDKDKFGLSVITFFVGLLFKPQAILFGPVMLLCAAREFAVIFHNFKNNNKTEGKKRLIFGFGGLIISALIFLLLSVVMANGQDLDWLIGKYSDTLGSYNYATLSGFGFMGLIGGQWVDATLESPFGISYSALGTTLMVIIFALAVALYCIRAKKEKGGIVPTKYLWLLASYTLAGFVIFSTRTHERYLFPAIAMLLISFAQLKDVRLLISAVAFAFTNFINTAIVLYVYEDLEKYMTKSEPTMILFSLLTVVIFIYLAFATVTIMINGAKEIEETHKTQQKNNGKNNSKNNSKNISTRKRNVPLKVNDVKSDGKLEKLMARRTFTLPKVTWKDIVICFVITAIYASVAFTNLGDVEAAQTQWWTGSFEPNVVCDLGEEKTFDKLSFSISSSGKVKIYTSADNENFTLYNEASFGSDKIGQWCETSEKETSARYIKIATSGTVSVSEAVILNNGEQLEVKDVVSNVNPIDSQSGNGNNLFDDTDCYSESQNYSVPKSGTTVSGTYTVKLKNPSKIDSVNAFFAGVNGSSSISIEERTLETYTTIFVINDEAAGWQSGLRYSLDDKEYSELRISIPSGLTVNEIVLKDENGKNIEVEYALPENNSQPIDRLFDEQSTYDEYESVLSANYGGEVWKITSCGDYVLADFGEVKKIDRGFYNVSICTGSFDVYYSYDGISWSDAEKYTVEQGNLYYWHGMPSNGSTYYDLDARYVAVCAENTGLKLIEMGFYESADSEQVIPIKSITTSNNGENGGAMLFDEQSLVPQRASYMNSMYFDEIYHARTAYESLNGLSIYEWTHPPLGKDIMSWSISIFGMTPFGWRFAGALAGVLMVPAMYFVGLLMFRKTSWAAILAAIMSLDGMHFAQTRLATIDSYGVLFIILMFLFMYWYYSLSFYNTPLKKTFIPLGLCGLSFGLGAASKWICLYAGAGLAIIFFITVFRRYGEYKTAKENIKTAKGEDKNYLKHIVDSFPKNTALTLLFCIGAFIVVPLIIYCASYYPYWNVEGETREWYEIIWENQKSMYSYHSTLEATHPFQSDWYTWPVIYKPIYIYAGSDLTSSENVATISSFGNPIIWYMGLAATIFGIFMLIMRANGKKLATSVKTKGFFGLFGANDDYLPDRNERDTRLLIFLALGVCCNLVPWMGISRCIFIYHYFATVPFIMMFTVYMFRNICRTKGKLGTILVLAFLAIALILFIMFKPVWTGTEVSREYVRTFLKWFDTWSLGV